MKLLATLFVLAATVASAEVINLETKQVTSNLPSHIVAADGKVYVGLQPVPLDVAATKGWRELPREKPTASPGRVIQKIEYKQDSKDPMKVEAVVTEKLESEIAQENADAEKAAAEEAKRKEAAAAAVRAERNAARQIERDEIVAPWPEGKERESIGRLFDIARPEW